METKEEHYLRIRNEITDGCLFIMNKNAFISKGIRWFDNNAEYSHVGLVFEKELGDRKRLFIIDSNETGVKPALLSDRLKECDSFLVIKPLCNLHKININLANSFDRAEKGIKYDYKNAIKEAFNRKLSTRFKIKLKDNSEICSQWTKIQAIEQDMVSFEFSLLELPFPQDYLRYRNIATTSVL